MNAPDAPNGRNKDLRVDGLHRSWATFASLAMVVLVGIQTSYNCVSIHEGTEQFAETIEEIREQSDTLHQIFKDQQRARLSFAVHVEEIEGQDPTAFRIVCPFAVGGTTEAKRVVIKNYISTGPPGQQMYLSSLDVDWETRDGHTLSDVSPTEEDRQFVAAPLSPEQLTTIVSGEESLYFVARLEYCDIYGGCRYFMRCAELGQSPNIVTYCGTRIGDRAEAGAEQP